MSLPPTPVRRSRRQRKSKTQYDDQVPWEDAVRYIRAESDSPDRSSASSNSEAVEGDIDLASDGDVTMHDGGAEQVGGEDGEFSDEAPSTEVETLDEDESGQRKLDRERWRLDVTPTSYTKKSVPRLRTKALAQEQGYRNRMLLDDALKLRLSKQRVWTRDYGPSAEDLYPMIRSRDVWHMHSRDVVLPSRKSVKHALTLQSAGRYLGRQNGPDEQLGPGSAPTGTGLETIQQSQPVADDTVSNSKYVDSPIANETVIGPWNRSTKYALEPGIPLNVSRKWSRLEPQPLPQDRTKQPLHTPVLSSPQQPTPHVQHRGWIINLGARPQCLGWAPNLSDGQYLAISFKLTKAQREAVPPRPSKLSPAFSVSPDYPTHIQIWQIPADGAPSDQPAGLGDRPDQSPQLLQRICFNYGNILRFEWLPVHLNDTSSVRRMSILTSDGNLRIIEINLDQTGSFEITQASLIAQPPSHTVYSAFTLPSQDDLIVGGADGAIRVYNINAPAADGCLTPYITIQLHNTYIMSLVCASDYPHLLTSSSASGDMILSDLRSPHQDRVRLHKSRLPTRNLAYLPHTRTFLSTSDASGNSEPHGTSLSTLTAQNIRHFYRTNTLLKMPEMRGIATVLATSSFHPFVLIANASGQVFSSNLLRRILPAGGGKGDEGAGWMLKLFEVDWIPLPQPPSASQPQSISAAYETKKDEKIDVYHGPDPRPGITRFTESFRPVPIELMTFTPDAPEFESSSPPPPPLAPSSSSSSKPLNPKKIVGSNKSTRKAEGVPSAASYQVTFHEEQAVTAMAWNNNPRFCTWAAVGWGSGILRVMDLGHGVS